MSGITVRDLDGEEVPALGDLVLQERRSYLVDAPGALQLRLGGRILQKSGHTAWVLPVEFWAGKTELAVEYPGRTKAHGVKVLPDPAKVGADTWESILADLEGLLPGLTHGAQGGEAGAVGDHGLSLPLLTQALLPLVPSLLKSLQAIVSEPRLHTTEEQDEIPLYCVRRVQRETVAWLTSHPSACAELGFAGDDGRSQATVPSREARDVLEHPANCYVAWLTWRVVRTLNECALQWANRPAADEDERAWCEARSIACQQAAASLDVVVGGSFLRNISRAPASDAALLVAIDDPRYARFQRQARRFLNPLFDPKSVDAPGAPLRPTFDIYELWCFLALARSIRSAFPAASASSHRLAKLRAGTGAGAKYSFQLSSGRKLEVEFNLTFASHWARGPNARRFSISG